MSVTVELIYFQGCPSWPHAWCELGHALAAAGVEAEVRLRELERLPEPARRGFAGSPTIRIEGADVEGYAGPPVLACRRYPGNAGRGWPDAQLLRQRLRAAARRAERQGEGRMEP